VLAAGSGSRAPCRTSKATQKQVSEGAGARKTLCPYSPSAPRNRPRETVGRVPALLLASYLCSVCGSG